MIAKSILTFYSVYMQLEKPDCAVKPKQISFVLPHEPDNFGLSGLMLKGSCRQDIFC